MKKTSSVSIWICIQSVGILNECLLGRCFQTMLLNCGAEEDSWESLGVQGDPTNQS